jgi:inosine/xanthosine triphosphatase
MNKAKNEAVIKVFTKVFGSVEAVPVESESGVSQQPMSDDEAIKGAINRAKQALYKVGEAEYGIGLEGTAYENEYGMFVGGWVAVVDRKGTTGIGASGKVLLPKAVADRLKKGEELRPVIYSLSESWNLPKEELDDLRSFGTLGILTKGLYTRINEFEEATKCALARIISREKYEK